MNTPLARAAFTTSFIRGAISPTRSVAPLHQCWFHISQMMSAVFLGAHSSAFSSTRHSPDLGADSTRLRVFSLSGSAARDSTPQNASTKMAETLSDLTDFMAGVKYGSAAGRSKSFSSCQIVASRNEVVA